MSTDGFAPDKDAVVYSLGGQYVDFAQIVKVYAAPREGSHRYSPAECVDRIKTPIHGSPDMSKVGTSDIERQNLTVRMSMRRMTRLTNAFFKKWENLKHSYALHFAYYDFCKVHSSLRVTPAMEAGITKHVWGIKRVVMRLSKLWLPRLGIWLPRLIISFGVSMTFSATAFALRFQNYRIARYLAWPGFLFNAIWPINDTPSMVEERAFDGGVGLILPVYGLIILAVWFLKDRIWARFIRRSATH